MDFLEMVIRLKIIYENKIVIIFCGAFFIAIGEDAILLNKQLRLKLKGKNTIKYANANNLLNKIFYKED